MSQFGRLEIMETKNELIISLTFIIRTTVSHSLLAGYNQTAVSIQQSFISDRSAETERHSRRRSADNFYQINNCANLLFV